MGEGHRRERNNDMDVKHYAYRVLWCAEDNEHVATVAEFPSLSWLAQDQTEALNGLVSLVVDTVAGMEATGEPIPAPIADQHHD